MGNKIKHLDIILSVITRMSSISFIIKGWTFTLASSLMALAAKDGKLEIMYICYFAIPLFWLLDAFFLSQERKFRMLYNEVTDTAEADITFKMDTSKYNSGRSTWSSTFFSNTLLLFYGLPLAGTIAALIILTNK